MQTLFDIQKCLRKGYYYNDHFHCDQQLPLVQDCNGLLVITF